MKKTIRLLLPLIVFLPLAAFTQQGARVPLSIEPSSAAPDPSVYVSAQQIAELLKNAEGSGPGDGQVPIVTQPPFQIDAVYRRGTVAEAFNDESDADLYVVLEGSGDLRLGGKLVGPKRAGARLTGSKAEGGTTYNLQKGDILMVPPNTPQYLSRADGTLRMIFIQVPVGNTNLWPAGNGFFAATGDPNIYISAAEIAERMSKADAAIAAGMPDRGPFTLLSQPPFRVTMDDRTIPNGHVDAHPESAELFIVLDGSGTIVVGGKLIGERGQGNDMMAPSTQGGILYKVTKGDLVLVPVHAGHAVVTVNGKLTMMQVHIPPPPAPKMGGPGGPRGSGSPAGPGGPPAR